MDDLLYTEYRLSHSLDITYTSPTADICEQVKEDYMDLLTNKTEYAKSLNSFIGLELEKKCTSSQVIENSCHYMREGKLMLILLLNQIIIRLKQLILNEIEKLLDLDVVYWILHLINYTMPLEILQMLV